MINSSTGKKEGVQLQQHMPCLSGTELGAQVCMYICMACAISHGTLMEPITEAVLYVYVYDAVQLLWLYDAL